MYSSTIKGGNANE